MDDTFYVSDRVGDAVGGGILAAQLLSHAVLAVALVYAIRRKKLFVATYTLTSLFCSVCYHACRGDLICVGTLSLDDWRRADHFTALALGAALGLELLEYDKAAAAAMGEFVRYLMPGVVFLAVQAHPFQLQSALIVVVFVGLVAVDRFLRTGHDLTPPDPRNYRVRSLTVGGILLVAAVVCYAFDSGDSRGDTLLDGIMHVVWHVLIGASIIATVDGIHTDMDTSLFDDWVDRIDALMMAESSPTVMFAWVDGDVSEALIPQLKTRYRNVSLVELPAKPGVFFLKVSL